MIGRPQATIDPARQHYDAYVAAAMATRIPAILKLAGEALDAPALTQLDAIARAVAARAPMVADLSDWPYAGWEDLPARVNGRRIGDAPFFDFEFWLYLRILQAAGYPHKGTDPFGPTKHRDLDRHLNWAEQAIQTTQSLPQALALSLEANAHDLSQLTRPEATVDLGRDALAIDPASISRLNLIADNFGGEFVGDLLLALAAVAHGIKVVIHVKRLPMFVSDTTMDDVTILLDHLGNEGQFAPRLSRAYREGTISFAAHDFWSSPQFLDQLPLAELGDEPNTLNVLKGDLNFRRAIGDIAVAPATPFAALPVLPAAPMLSLRSIKSYCVAGLSDWPDTLSRTDFPTDGTIVVAQQIPVRAGLPIASAESSSDAAPLLPRVRRWLRR